MISCNRMFRILIPGNGFLSQVLKSQRTSSMKSSLDWTLIIEILVGMIVSLRPSSMESPSGWSLYIASNGFNLYPRHPSNSLYVISAVWHFYKCMHSLQQITLLHFEVSVLTPESMIWQSLWYLSIFKCLGPSWFAKSQNYFDCLRDHLNTLELLTFKIVKLLFDWVWREHTAYNIPSWLSFCLLRQRVSGLYFGSLSFCGVMFLRIEEKIRDSLIGGKSYWIFIAAIVTIQVLQILHRCKIQISLLQNKIYTWMLNSNILTRK